MNSAEPIIVEVEIKAPITKVWKALTENDKLKKWYFDLEEFKPEKGFEFKFVAGDKDKKFLHECVIQEVEPHKKLSYTWRYPKYPGMSLVTWELQKEQENLTRIRLTHEGLETFPQETSDFSRENFVGGWNYFLNTALKDYLED